MAASLQRCFWAALAALVAAAAPATGSTIPNPGFEGSVTGWRPYQLSLAADPQVAHEGKRALRLTLTRTRCLSVYVFPLNRSQAKVGEVIFDDAALVIEAGDGANLVRNPSGEDAERGFALHWNHPGMTEPTSVEVVDHRGNKGRAIYVKDDEPHKQEYVVQSIPWRDEYAGHAFVFSAWVKSPKGAGTVALSYYDGAAGRDEPVVTGPEWQQVKQRFTLPSAEQRLTKSGMAWLQLPRPDLSQALCLRAWIRSDGEARVSVGVCGMAGGRLLRWVYGEPHQSAEFRCHEVVVEPTRWSGHEDGLAMGLSVSGPEKASAWVDDLSLRSMTPLEMGGAAATASAEGRAAFSRAGPLGWVADPRPGLAARARPKRILGRDFWHVMHAATALEPVLKDLPMTRDSGRFLSHYTFWRPLEREFERVPAGPNTPVLGQCLGVELNHGAFLDPAFCRTGVPATRAASHGPELAIDRDRSLTSAWWSANDVPQWIEVDLAEPTTIDAIRLVTYYGDRRSYKYTIAVSADGRAYRQVVDMTDNTAAAPEKGMLHRFDPVLAKSIHVTITGNSVNSSAHVVEIEASAAGRGQAQLVRARAQSTQGADGAYDVRPLDDKVADVQKFYGKRFWGFSFGEWGNGWGMLSNWRRNPSMRKDGEYWKGWYWGRNLQQIKEPAFPEPSTRLEAYQTISAEFRRLLRLVHGDAAFMHCSQLWDHYGFELGARWVEAEYECCYHLREIQIAFSRGAARQYQRPWGVSVGTFLGPAYRSYREQVLPNPDGRGSSTGGRSISCMRRECYLSYLSGVNFYRGYTPVFVVRGRNQAATAVSPYGRMHEEFHGFAARHPDRGTPYTPIAVLLDFVQSPWTPVAHDLWFRFALEAPDRMIEHVMRTFWPYVPHPRRECNGACLVNSPFGNLVDVLKPNPPSGPASLDALRPYAALVLAGSFDMTPALAQRLMEYVQAGGTLVINERQLGGRFPESFLGGKVEGSVRRGRRVRRVGEPLADCGSYSYRAFAPGRARALFTAGDGAPIVARHAHGRGAVILTTPAWMATDSGRAMPILFDLLAELAAETLPLRVEGDIGYTLSRTDDGWVVGLYNNKGVTKEPHDPPAVDASAAARVHIVLPTAPKVAEEWVHDTKLSAQPCARGAAVALDVPAGEVRVVHIVE